MLRLSLFLLIALTSIGAAAESPLPTDTELQKILAERIDVGKQSVGIVIGIVEPQGRRIIAYGQLATGDNRHLDGNTVFEIGSMTKVFTSLLLSDMAQRGEVKLDDPVAKYLPPSVKLPERNGRSIEFIDIATQSSGLPRMPDNFTPADPANPYADYSVEQLYRFLSVYQLPRDIGAQYEYSNLAVGLMGHALALRAGTDYESLVRSRICDPLGMSSTRITLTPDMQARLAVGHDAMLSPVKNWDLPTLAGAGALRSTANDILTFLAANIGYSTSPLSPAMTAMLSVRRPTGQPDLAVALGWHVYTRHDRDVVWHNGGTGGYRTFMGFDPKTRVGVVVLSNASTGDGVDDIGFHLLDPAVALAVVKAPKEHKEVKVDPKLYDFYVGLYQLAPNFVFTVTRDGDHLFAQLTGQQKLELFPEGERDYFYKAVDAQITFEAAPQAQAGALVLHQNGRDQAAKRVNAAEVSAAAEALANRIKDGIPQPGSEAALRHQIDEMQRGQPDYTRMSDTLAQATREHLPKIQGLFSTYGALQSIAFKGVGPRGGDIYEVKFANAETEWRIVMAPDGKIEGVVFH